MIFASFHVLFLIFIFIHLSQLKQKVEFYTETVAQYSKYSVALFPRTFFKISFMYLFGHYSLLLLYFSHLPTLGFAMVVAIIILQHIYFYLK